MLFSISFKTPDALYYALEDMEENQREEAKKFAEHWVRHGEFVEIEFDTVARTATVKH